MYIEFQLPPLNNGSYYSRSLAEICRAIDNWSMKYRMLYTEQLSGEVYRIQFEDEDTYSFFCITWDPVPRMNSTNWDKISVIDADLPEKLTEQKISL
jgi:hypothetical protein